jgi:hypothetical protein
VDPLTDHRDWVVVAPTDTSLTGVYDVQSAKPAPDPNAKDHVN